MSPDPWLGPRYELRRQRLADNRTALRRLMARAPSGSDPDPLDLPGIAWLLTSIYTEWEEVLKAIAVRFADPIPSSTHGTRICWTR
jgi:hypothetical protein